MNALQGYVSFAKPQVNTVIKDDARSIEMNKQEAEEKHKGPNLDQAILLRRLQFQTTYKQDLQKYFIEAPKSLKENL